MKRLKKVFAVSLVVFALATTITLCGGGGDVHPIGNINIQQSK